MVKPNISPIYRRQFQDQNFVVIDATGEEFFRTLIPAVQAIVPSRLDLLGNKHPHQIAAIRDGAYDTQAEVLRQFDFVGGDTTPTDRNTRTFFFEGAEPTWDDIRRNVDAQRDITSDYLQVLNDEIHETSVIGIVGQAGSGKSTTVKRLAFELARDGRSVYFSKTDQTLNQQAILDMARLLGDKQAYIFIDDARDHVLSVRKLMGELPAESKITFILVDRPHVLLPRLLNQPGLKPKILEMPQLIRSDCERIINKLEEFGFPGALRGMSKDQQLREFLGRSRKQLLVAMKEATSGHGFDAIIEHEYSTLANDNARMAYTIACLAYMHGAPVHRRHLIACLEGTDVEKANTLERDLQGVVLSWKGNEELMSPRHRIIAEHVATGAATFEIRQEAIKRFLIQVSSEINAQKIRRRTPEFIAYRAIINFDNMQRLFGEDRDETDSIYNELVPYYGDDYLFWLQYGRAEVYSLGV